MDPSIPEPTFLSFYIVIIGHYERTFTTDCVKTKSYILLVNEMNATCSRCPVGRDSSVGIATRYGLEYAGIKSC